MSEIADGERFAFGQNWARFLELLDEQRIADAMESLRSGLETHTLEGRTFLDIGSGSGLFSLAARRLGARVVSFDYDPQSVACTRELKRRFFDGDEDWTVEQGSALDTEYVDRLGRFDVVYSWGVLHHTGDMWSALANADRAVADAGRLFLAIYNYQPLFTGYWTFEKRMFNRYRLARPVFFAVHAIYPTLPRILLRWARRRRLERGMDIWRDLVDWLGGYPFEAARPEHIFDFYRSRGYRLNRLTTVGGRHGCNEFVFEKRA